VCLCVCVCGVLHSRPHSAQHSAALGSSTGSPICFPFRLTPLCHTPQFVAGGGGGARGMCSDERATTETTNVVNARHGVAARAMVAFACVQKFNSLTMKTP
jgi:hypothetical protein